MNSFQNDYINYILYGLYTSRFTIDTGRSPSSQINFRFKKPAADISRAQVEPDLTSLTNSTTKNGKLLLAEN